MEYKLLSDSDSDNFRLFGDLLMANLYNLQDFSKIANAFTIPYFKITNHQEVSDTLRKVYASEGAVICEVMQDKEQTIEPRVMSRKLDDGSIISPVIDDLFPFLEREEYATMQYPVNDKVNIK